MYNSRPKFFSKKRKRRSRKLLDDFLILSWLVSLILGLIRSILEWMRTNRQQEPPTTGRGKSQQQCMPVSSKVYRRPDPMIYDQYYLMSQGIGVTWDNPDIELRRNGMIIPSTEVAPDTDYEIVARIWNGRTDALAIDMPVAFSYLSFGIGTKYHPIDVTTVDLPARGAPGHPAFAHMPWHSPAVPGHYCLQVELFWSDDANPSNNLGQKNLQVRPLNSPHAQFQFPVRNDARRARTFLLEADAYSIPSRRACDPNERADTPELTPAEIQAHMQEAHDRNNRQNFPVPPGWIVDIAPREVQLPPEGEQLVVVDITAPDGFRGRQALNVHAFDGSELVGGVTLFVEG